MAKKQRAKKKDSWLERLVIVRYFRNLPSYVSLALFVLLLATVSSLSSLFQVQSVGQIAIGIYFVLALIFKIDSRTTFKMALISLLGVAGLSAASPENDMTDTLAVYTYLLLVVGVVTAIVESIRDGRNHGQEAVDEVKASVQFVRSGLRKDQVRPVKYMARTAMRPVVKKPQYVAQDKRAVHQPAIKNDHVYPQGQKNSTSVKNTQKRRKLVQL